MADRGQYPIDSDAADIRSERVRFQTNNSSNPLAANTYDPGVIASTITRAAAGRILVTLRERYTRIFPAVTLTSTNAVHSCKIYAVVEGTAAANSVEIHTLSTQSAADLVDIPITLLLDLQP